jgi:hypothetical protein
VDKPTRHDIAAAAAAHRELGRESDDAVAEGLVVRMGAEIDKRIDAGLRAGLARQHTTLSPRIPDYGHHR